MELSGLQTYSVLVLFLPDITMHRRRADWALRQPRAGLQRRMPSSISGRFHRVSEEEAYEFVKGTLREERISPYRPEELQVVKSVSACINCGLCISHCPVVAAVGQNKFSGPRSIAVELSRSPPEYWSTADIVYLCTGCGTCKEVCPKNVDIPEVVDLVRARIFEYRPDLVPKSLHIVRETLREHNLAFEPWDDIEEKHESRDMRLERLKLPYVPDRMKSGAEVLFYPGCQAEERAQEVREAAKVILDYFGVDFTLLEDMTCCSLPARLVGDDKTARKLSDKLRSDVKELGVEKIVTTCAGCTGNLAHLAERDEWGVPAFHLLEYLVSEIGVERIAEAMKGGSQFSDVTVTVHDPCHLIRHTSRQIMDYAADILSVIPGVTVKISDAHDSCCGGGGLVSYHSSGTANAVVAENLRAIDKTGAERLVTPCPLCTAQIESNLFKSGSSVEVDDLTVFIAQRLPKKE
ncbi:(Fe-S)-binding protein [Candidatus Thorarchaeota archaeon]|nr:MAG: (Fe-S)-binding protein [Candidatus Thorarchaeota archaeon]